jgi:integrase
MSERIPLVMKFEDWPDADRLAWDAFYTEGDIFDGEGPFRNWSEGSRKKRRQSYGQWLSFLLRQDSAALALAPAERFTKDRVGAFLEECEARLKTRSTAGLILDLYVLARAFDPGCDWAWLDRAARRLLNCSGKESLPEAKPVTAQEIWRWSIDRLAEIDGPLALSPLQRAISYRQALMIGFLIARPVRRRALLAMTVERHLVRHASGFDVAFAAEDMKDGRARTAPLPQALVGPMGRYLHVHRPILLGDNVSPSLWISQYGQPLTADGFSRELPKVTERLLGVALRPHAFRHVVATSVAESDPEHINIVRDLLGHTTLDMAEKHYNRATGISSCNALQSIVEDIRKDVPKMARAKRKLSGRSRPEASE